MQILCIADLQAVVAPRCQDRCTRRRVLQLAFDQQGGAARPLRGVERRSMTAIARDSGPFFGGPARITLDRRTDGAVDVPMALALPGVEAHAAGGPAVIASLAGAE